MSDQGDRFLVDCIYSSAVAPSRFEHLIENWDNRLRASGYSREALSLLNNSQFVEHVANAEQIAGRIGTNATIPLVEQAVARIETASFTCSAEGRILSCNPAARSAFRVSAGETVQNLPLSPDGVRQFLSSISAVAGADDGRHEVLRLHSEKGSRPFFLFVRPIRDEQGRRLTLIVSTEYVWQKQVETALQRSFSFTPAELNVLRLVLSGLTVAEIATTLGRLESTIRSQIHGLLSKSGARSQAELISLTLAFQDSTDEDAMARLMPAPVGASRQNPYQTLVLSDGRNLQYLKLGDPRGSPFLWLHGNLAQCRLPQPAEHWLKQNGLSMIVPIRAGYGYSSPIPAGADVLKLAVADILALTDYLRISTAPVIAHCNDFLLACHLALAESSCFPHVVGVGAAFAIDNPEEYARLSKWARFFRANARHAPKVLSFLGRTAYTLLRTIGPERYLEMVLRGTPDYAALSDPDVRRAFVAGMEINWGDDVRAHEAFAADTVAVHAGPWPQLTNLKGRVTLIHGEHDPNASHAAAAERAERFGWQFLSVPNAGSFVHFSDWPLVFGAVAEIVTSQPSRQGPISIK